MSLSLPEMLQRMLLLRAFEERLLALAREGKVPLMGPWGGNEASALGVISTLEKEDLLLTNHRNMSHFLARGAELPKVVAEIFGKRTGYCQGKSGPLHISMRELGIVLTSTVVGAELSLAPGVALAQSMLGSSAIVTCFFGDGAACEGVFHESLNIASLWQLPILYVCENNQWQGTIATKNALAAQRVSSFGAPHGIQSLSVDGMDVEAVREAAQAAAAYVRKERRPFLLETVFYRLRGHSMTDTQAYVNPAELAAAWERDPLLLLSRRLAQAGMVTDEARAEMKRAAEEEVERAITFAFESPFPDPAELLTDVFA